MPIHPIGIRLNGWDTDPHVKAIEAFKFHSKFNILPKADLVPLKENFPSSSIKLVSPIKQLIDQTKEEQKRNNSISEESITKINMGIASPHKSNSRKRKRTKHL